MNTEIAEYEEIEVLRQAIINVMQATDQYDPDRLKLILDILLAGTSQVGTIFQQRCVQLAGEKQPKRTKPPKASPQRGPQQRKQQPSTTDTPKQQNGAEDRSKELSSIQQGIRQADPSLSDQQRALRGNVYGAQNNDVAFRKAAKAIAS